MWQDPEENNVLLSSTKTTSGRERNASAFNILFLDFKNALLSKKTKRHRLLFDLENREYLCENAPVRQYPGHNAL